jgi:hypothetical protein
MPERHVLGTALVAPALRRLRRSIMSQHHAGRGVEATLDPCLACGRAVNTCLRSAAFRQNSFTPS